MRCILVEILTTSRVLSKGRVSILTASAGVLEMSATFRNSHIKSNIYVHNLSEEELEARNSCQQHMDDLLLGKNV